MTIENTAEIVTAVAAIGSIVAALINGKRIREIHVLINSRLDQLLRATGIAARAEGAALERRDASKKDSE